MFPSTIIISAPGEKLDTKISTLCSELGHKFLPNNPDLVVIDFNEGGGIDQIRNLKTYLSQKPFNHANKIVVIHNAQLLNAESQNALLKTLEDPGPNNYLILTTSRPSALLPTITSRCHHIKLQNPAGKSENNLLLETTGDPSDSLALSERLSADKNAVLPFLEDQLSAYQQQLVSNPSTLHANKIKKIIKAIQMIRANVDPRSALDYLLLS